MLFSIFKDGSDGKYMLKSAINPRKKALLQRNINNPVSFRKISSREARILWNTLPIAEVSAIGRKFSGRVESLVLGISLKTPLHHPAGAS